MSAVRRRRADRQDRPAEPLPASAMPIEEAGRAHQGLSRPPSGRHANKQGGWSLNGVRSLPPLFPGEDFAPAPPADLTCNVGALLRWYEHGAQPTPLAILRMKSVLDFGVDLRLLELGHAYSFSRH